MPWLDVDRPRLAGIGATIQIRARRNMGVIEAETCRLRQEGDPPHASCRHEGGAFFGRTVDISWRITCPCDAEFRHVGVVVDIDNRPLSLLEAVKDGPGN